MQRHPGFRSPARQRGATLVIAMLILVLIMMIGVTAVSTSNTQYKLAGNLQFENAAMNNAEAAVAAGENWLATNSGHAGFTTYSAQATPQLHPLASTATVATSPLTATWSDSNSLGANGGSQRYVIQLMSTNNLLQGSSAAVGRQGMSVCNKVNTFLITGRGTSVRGAVKFVQSYFSVFSC
jgi:Tfp pilus assembly protein PilX